MKKLFKCMASAMVMALALGNFSTNTINAAYEISTQDTQGNGFKKSGMLYGALKLTIWKEA